MNQRHEQDPIELGEGLAFVIGAFRSGTTLLRKTLNAHPAIHSPAETWFLLPLLNLWEGAGTCSMYKPSQAATAIKQHLSQDAFIDCCRAFAGRFYRGTMPDGASWFVDKTPTYLSIAHALPAIFPRARFMYLVRDPRAIAWSRFTWRHSGGTPLETIIVDVAADVRRLAACVAARPETSCSVSYEQLCDTPADPCNEMCRLLGLKFNPSMLRYGSATHHEGYGDENTRAHGAPHTQSVQRWKSQGMPQALQDELIERCGKEALMTLGYAEIADSVAA